MSLSNYAARNRFRLGGGVALVVVVLVALVALDVPLRAILTVGFAERALRAASPIALAAVGGLYAEKSGVFNIGLEGFMIFGAVTTAATAFVLGGDAPSQADLWLGIGGAVLFCTVLSVVFAALLVWFRGNQIVAGLAVWFIGLGFGPFIAVLLWGNRNSPGLVSIRQVSIPVLSELPVVGPVLFETSPLVWVALVVAVAAWVFLFRTKYGYWLQAAGENPEALDTAGIDVARVRFAAVVFSGALAGLGGAVLLAHAGSFNGTGDTMVNGRGWIAIVAYLFGNYNPLGAAGAAVLFGGLDMLQIQFQTANVAFPNKLLNLFPYVVVIAVLTVWGSTRMPASVGEPYESEQ